MTNSACRGPALRLIILAVGALVAGLATGRAEPVYENADITAGFFLPVESEVGDEVRLAGSARGISKFQIEYYANFPTNATVMVIVRLYDHGDDPYDPPRDVLYSSGPVPLTRPKPPLRVGTITVSDVDIAVPSRITWTVEFTGLAGGASSQAGVMLYNPPSIGSSFDDYWYRVPGTGVWEARVIRTGNPPPRANFGARFEALPDPPSRWRPHPGRPVARRWSSPARSSLRSRC